MSLLRWMIIYHGRKEWYLSLKWHPRKAILAAHRDANEVFSKIYKKKAPQDKPTGPS